MDVFECVKTKMAVRDFKKDLLPNSLILRILEAGRYAPSSDNYQPWHFLVIKDQFVLEKAVKIGGIRPFVATAPIGIAIIMENYDRPLLDAGRALQQMQLVAWSDGIGSCFVGIPPDNIPSLKQFLRIPEEFELISIMPFGFPKNDREIGSKSRKPLSKITHSEFFDNAYEPHD
jgi:nitroreductase